ncbi:MAG TPA: carbamoyl-phosphate synthase (glutamine-hydrolyzing) large subunit [Burkholderiales bacterium]|nr:carbamoyl-phosphate synthase (glutamine-hydrolyzing) large subunit [Burkholderiales bacterium]
MGGIHLPGKPRRVMVLGSGALQIGQAGEFDYSGSQALKALREEGIATVLVNPNIATIQTSRELAERIYLVAVTPALVEKIIAKEGVDAIALGFGGQTALNCGLALHDAGIFARHGIEVLGTPIEAIRDTEDRRLFVERLAEIGVNTARSRACNTPEAARQAIAEIGLPVMLRAGYALGGKGSGIVRHGAGIDGALRRAFAGGATQVLVEECLEGWKEIEYEVVRDAGDDCIAVCNMENLDPMGIHTGDSIVVAPSQTLNDAEYQLLRRIALRTIRHLGIVGECNIQFALDPRGTDYRVIEVNARLSRSSALASKATGYPLAYVAAKLALGYRLAEIPNGITRRTTAFFEPALDYLVCKFPRWDLGKFRGASARIGSEMKSVGEVMAIGRSFAEVIQKAARMLDIGVRGVDPDAFRFEDLRAELRHATPLRLFAVAQAMRDGMGIDEIHELTRIDRWFLHALEPVVSMHGRLARSQFPLAADLLREAKRLGFSDQGIAALAGSTAAGVRSARQGDGISARFAQIDTLAGEFPAVTNYLYATYHADTHDAAPSPTRKVLILGSGTYRIGASVEFDWCAVNAAQAAAALGYETIMLNHNPETVSTDYDTCERLYFDEISVESVLDLVEHERPEGVVVSMGGQIANNLALALARAGVRLLGTSAESIDTAEDRAKFSALLDTLGIEQPRWAHVSDAADADRIVERLGGYPVLVRPSYVLSGAAMAVAHEAHQLGRILARAAIISREHPVVVSKFETHAREIEIDAVADRGEIVLSAICEHVEDAGVHSGDATLVLPPQSLSGATLQRVRQIATMLARALAITGPFNVQFLVRQSALKVIECNLRASRSLPFVSKATGANFAAEAMRRMLGVRRPSASRGPELGHVAVKAPMFSFARVAGADPVLGVEMLSTGEVGCLGRDVHEALEHALLATGINLPRKAVLLSLGPMADKYSFADEVRALAHELALPIYATRGTAEMLAAIGVACTSVEKASGSGLSALEVIEQRLVDLVINIPREYDARGRPDGYLIRRQAIDTGVPLVTDLAFARAIVAALRSRKSAALEVVAWNDFLHEVPEHGTRRAAARAAR